MTIRRNRLRHYRQSQAIGRPFRLNKNSSQAKELTFWLSAYNTPSPLFAVDIANKSIVDRSRSPGSPVTATDSYWGRAIITSLSPSSNIQFFNNPAIEAPTNAITIIVMATLDGARDSFAGIVQKHNDEDVPYVAYGIGWNGNEDNLRGIMGEDAPDQVTTGDVGVASIYNIPALFE